MGKRRNSLGIREELNEIISYLIIVTTGSLTRVSKTKEFKHEQL